jgi:hypothetical protein
MASRAIHALLLIVSLCFTNICCADGRAELLKALNKDLPKMYNDQVELSSIELDGDNMIFNYRMVQILDKDVNPSKIEDLRNELRESACSTASSMDLLRKGVIINHVFKDKNNKFITKKIITLSDCEE